MDKISTQIKRMMQLNESEILLIIILGIESTSYINHTNPYLEYVFKSFLLSKSSSKSI